MPLRKWIKLGNPAPSCLPQILLAAGTHLLDSIPDPGVRTLEAEHVCALAADFGIPCKVLAVLAHKVGNILLKKLQMTLLVIFQALGCLYQILAQARLLVAILPKYLQIEFSKKFFGDSLSRLQILLRNLLIFLLLALSILLGILSCGLGGIFVSIQGSGLGINAGVRYVCCLD